MALPPPTPFDTDSAGLGLKAIVEANAPAEIAIACLALALVLGVAGCLNRRRCCRPKRSRSATRTVEVLATAPLGMISAPRGAKFSQFDIETPMKEFRRGDEVLGDTGL